MGIEINKKISPASENSKKENFPTPLFSEIPDTIKLVLVPINVQLPPKMPAKETGSKTRDLSIFPNLSNSLNSLITIMTTAVVAIKEENTPTKIIKSGKNTQKGQLTIGIIFVTIQDTTPVFSKPMAIIIRHNMVKTELSENPETACSGVTIPKSNRLKRIKKDVLSTVNFSLTNKPKATIKMPLTIPISKVIVDLLRILKLDKRNGKHL
jgi:hypothetical protein